LLGARLLGARLLGARLYGARLYVARYVQSSGMSAEEIIGQFALELQPETSALQRLRAALAIGAKDKLGGPDTVLRFGENEDATALDIKYFNAGLRRLCRPFREFNMDEVSELFVAFDADGSGSISKEELCDYIRKCEADRSALGQSADAAATDTTANFEQRLAAIRGSGKSYAAIEERELDEAMAAVAELRKSIFETWGIMYCGGSAPIINDLRTVSTQYGINLALESFSW
jgi:hypothetical protein